MKKEKVKLNFKLLITPIMLSIVLGIIISITSIVLSPTAFYKSAETVFQRAFFSQQNKNASIYHASPYLRDFVLIPIDDQTFSSLNAEWPIPRSYYAKLIEKLSKSGAKLICFDIIFPDKSSFPQDEALAQQIKDNPDLLLAYHLSLLGVNPDNPSEKKLEIILPYKLFLDALGNSETEHFEKLGFVSTSTDQDVDGLIRSVTFIQPHENKSLVSFDVKILMNILNAGADDVKVDSVNNTLIIKDKVIPLNKNYALDLNFGFTPKNTDYTVDIIPFSEVLNMPDDKLAGYFKDKIILLGVTATGGHDIKYFPVGSMPGIYGHLNAIFTVLDNKFIHTIPPSKQTLWILAFGLIVGIASALLRPRYSIIILILFSALAVWLSYDIFKKYCAFIPILPTLSNIILTFVVVSLYKYQQEQHAKKKLSVMLREFAPLPPDYLDQVIAETTGSAQLGGHRVTVSILFSDIRGYTDLSEKLDPVEVMNMLNEYHSAMGHIFEENGGVIFDYQGDAQMVVFGLVEPSKENHAFYAVKSGLQMQEKVKGLMEQWGGRHAFEVGVGVCTGPVSLGIVGSAQRKQYAAIGDSTNVSARLQGMSKQLESPVLISESTYLMCKDKIETDKLEPVKLKGKSEPLQVYRANKVK
ncbi:MAG: adenylate/guanylate cyclase domain-containing protein [Armatimonadota bacterium]